MSALLTLRARLRFALWALRARAELRRRGGRLVVRGWARFDGPPRLKATAEGEGHGVTTFEFEEGVRLGRDLHLDVWAHGTNRMTLGAGVAFDHAVRIQLRGGSVELGDFTYVRDGATFKSDGELVLGRAVLVTAWAMLACTQSLRIGDRCGLGERVSIVDSDHSPDGSDRHWVRQPVRCEPVELAENVLVSANVTILRGARVGANALVAAGSVLRGGEYPASHLIAGAPARAVRPLS